MRSLLIRLYPARWRARYGDEFEAILEERPLGPFDVADILLGALDAHLHLRGRGADMQNAMGFSMSLRLGGAAAILGAILFLTGFVVSFDRRYRGRGGVSRAALILAGTALLLLALIGLSSFQARRHPRLIWTAFAVPAIGLTMTGVGIVGMAAPETGHSWRALARGHLDLGRLCDGRGFGPVRDRDLPNRRLAAGGRGPAWRGLAVLLAVFVLGMGLVGVPEGIVPALILVGLLAFTAGWVALGWTAIRLEQPSAARDRPTLGSLTLAPRSPRPGPGAGGP